MASLERLLLDFGLAEDPTLAQTALPRPVPAGAFGQGAIMQARADGD
jgi:hypothetical protein